jgi:hypothetical protein
LSIMTPPSPHPAPIFVDASTSFGIGFWWDNHWLAWCFWRVGIVRAGILVGWKWLPLSWASAVSFQPVFI